MVAIKQVANSALPEIRKDEPADVSRSAMQRPDHGQKVKLAQQEVQKKLEELLAKAKQRKKQAEEQLAPSPFSPVITTSSMPLNKQLALPNIAQQPEWVSLQKQGVLVQGHEAADQSQTVKETPAKPIVDKASGVVATEVLTKLTETLTQSQGIPRDNGEQPLPHLVSATRDKPEMSMASISSFKGEGYSEVKAYSSDSQDMTDMPRSAVEPSIVTTSERESAPSLPLAEKNESTLSNDRTPVLTTQPLPAQQLATQAPTVTQPEEVKTPPPAVMTALPERAESDATAGRRTLSYTFTQWNNSPMVKFELSQAGELTAMTHSAEVQQALQDNHHLLESENPLNFREERRDEESERRGQQQSEQEDET
ncbi:TPA: type III secretion protein [Yersinia enterocolitica]|nr:type III secretion protein [Yersinia enterocolitica]